MTSRANSSSTILGASHESRQPVTTTPSGLGAIDAAKVVDVIARMLRTADEIRKVPSAQQASVLSLFVADANLLTGMMGDSWGRSECVAVADRLWLATLSPLEVYGLVVAAGASWAEKLIDTGDALRIARTAPVRSAPPGSPSSTAATGGPG